MNYPEIINKTAVFPKKVEDFTLAYFTLGLFDEMDELLEKIINLKSSDEIIAEAGDVCWYVCGIANYLNIDFMQLVNNRNNIEPNINPFSLLGLVKKYYRDDKPLDIKTVEEILKCILNKAIANIDPEIILKTNYDKLMSRFERNAIKGDGDNR